MAKKAGKQGTQPAAPAAEAQGEQKKNNGVYINNVSQKLIFDVQGKDQKDYKSINMDIPGHGMCSFLVSPGKVLPSTKRNGAENVGFNNIYLGTPGTHINVSPKTKDASGKYPESFQMTAQELADTWKANQKAYQESKKAQRDVPETEAAAAEAEMQAGE